MDVRLFDNYYRTEYPCGDYIEVTCTFPRLKLPDGTLNLKGQDPLAELAFKCETTVVPVVIDFEGGAGRWSGRIDVAHDKINPDGTETVECELVGDLTMLDRIVAWPQPFLPIEVQPSEAVLIGPAITVFKTLVAENCMRLQLGLWELFNTLGSLDLDWRTWFGTILMQNSISLSDFMQMVTTPVCVIPTDPLTDTSPWVEVNGRMDTLWKLMRQQLADNGIYPSMDLWMPGEPQPEGLLWDLQVPTLCFNLRDYLGVTGPTGTVVDGAVQDLVDLEGSLLGGVLNPFLNPNNEYVPPGSDIVIAPTLGVNFVPPWVVFNADADDSGIVSMDVAHHHPVCWQVILGGKSPKWLNDFMNASLEYLVDILMMTIGITGISNTVLDGVVDNAFLAFELFEWFDRRVKLGPYGFPERFFPTQSTYDIDAVFAAISAGWDTDGYPAAQFTFYHGMPWRLFKDVFPGQLASLIRRGVLYTDYLDEIKVIDNPEIRGRIDVQVGDGRREEAPMTLIQRKIVDVEQGLMLALGAPPNG
ncbi:hypothetical protein BMW24_003440 [Mycobacterium heckeshornense]|nr:hypothetical protein BMW24_003155 [Mycobacterium heckeshornense]PIJ37093.1 hypothetical protein BMW24_003440 [Mycobacterium heckeshornense]